MSNINNHGVDMNNNTLAQLNLSAVKELNDEVAATCSGGEGFFSDPSVADVVLYKDLDGKGQSIGINAKTGDGLSNIGLFPNGHETTFNDTVSSIFVRRGTWSFFQDQGYRGDTTGALRPGVLYNLGHNNDAITSAFRESA